MFSIFRKANQSDMERIESLLKESIPGTVADDQPYKTILANATQNNVHESVNKKTPAKQRPGSLALKRIAVVTIVSALSYAVYDNPIKSPKEFSSKMTIDQAIAAMKAPDQVTYYKIIEIRGGKPLSESETWVDYDKKMSKSLHKTLVSDFRASTLIRDGIVKNTEEVRGSVAVQESSLKFHDSLRDTALMYMEMVKSEKRRKQAGAVLIGEEKVNGIDTYKLKIEHNMGSDIFDKPFFQIATINIRKDNYRPLRIFKEDILVEKDGSRTYRDKPVTTLYEDIKLIDRDALGKNFFTLEIPKYDSYQISNMYTLSNIKNFKEFDLYWLGENWQGLTLVDTFTYDKTDDAAVKINQNELSFGYYHSVKDYEEGKGGAIGFSVRPIDHPLAKDPSQWNKSGKISRLVINGISCTLLEEKFARGRIYYHIFVPMGNASVKIASENKELVKKAAGALKKLN